MNAQLPGGPVLQARLPLLLLLAAIGLALPASATPVEEVEEEPISEYDRSHWSFRPIGRPVLPSVQDCGWCQNAGERDLR